MSVPTPRQAFAFLAPLRRRTSVFIIPGRRRNSMVGRFLLGCLAASRMPASIFDTSSFYGANIGTLTDSLPRDFLQQSTLTMPGEDNPVEDSLADVLSVRSRAIIIDDLNALHHLLSADAQRGAIHTIFKLLGLLSYEARICNLSVFATVYKSERDSTEKVTKRSLSAAADLQIATDDRLGRLTFRCNEIGSWPNGRFSAPLYFEPST
jgi:hypothetical protein